jgi:hypothetical protein
MSPLLARPYRAPRQVPEGPESLENIGAARLQAELSRRCRRPGALSRIDGSIPRLRRLHASARPVGPAPRMRTPVLLMCRREAPRSIAVPRRESCSRVLSLSPLVAGCRPDHLPLVRSLTIASPSTARAGGRRPNPTRASARHPGWDFGSSLRPELKQPKLTLLRVHAYVTPPVHPRGGTHDRRGLAPGTET